MLVAAGTALAATGAVEPPTVRRHPPDGSTLAWIPPGAFRMGAEPAEVDAVWKEFGWPEPQRRQARRESPAHRVELDGFWLAREEVTVAQFRRFAAASGREMPDPPEWGWEETHPVVNVSWDDAMAYCAWAAGRLPSEAEWERAARGPDTGLGDRPARRFVWGDVAPAGAGPCGNLADEPLQVRFPDREVFPGYRDGFLFTAPVGSFPATGHGLKDMAGNVFEWCADWYEEGYYRRSPNRNPRGPTEGLYRVLRGGSWLSNPYGVRVSYRYYDLPAYRSYYVGFRIAVDAQPPPTPAD